MSAYCPHGMHHNAFHCVGCADEHEARKAAHTPAAGDVVTWRTAAGPAVALLVAVTRDGLHLRATDGHTDYWPTTYRDDVPAMLARLDRADAFTAAAFRVRDTARTMTAGV